MPANRQDRSVYRAPVVAGAFVGSGAACLAVIGQANYLTGIVVPAGMGTALTLFFALPLTTRSLYVR